jgi:hypothetical protein
MVAGDAYPRLIWGFTRGHLVPEGAGSAVLRSGHNERRRVVAKPVQFRHSPATVIAAPQGAA